MTITIWGIPSCGTVKKAQAALSREGIAFVSRDLRTAPPTRADVERFVAAVGAKALRNTSGGSYRALGPEKDTFTDMQWVDAYVADPMLIKRPVIERDGVTVGVGFKDEAILDVLR